MAKHGKATATPNKIQQQKEAAAKLAAERVTAPAEAEDTEVAVPASKPLTLAEKLRKIDDEIAEQVRGRKLALAKEAARDAQNALQAYLDDLEDETLRELRSAVSFANRQVREFGGDSEQPQASAAASNGSGEKRTRRGAEELKDDARKMVALLKEKGKATGAELEAVAQKKAGMKLADFIEEFGGVKVEKHGDRGANVSYSLK